MPSSARTSRIQRPIAGVSRNQTNRTAHATDATPPMAAFFFLTADDRITNLCFRPTSKMSHDHSRHGSCSFRLMVPLLHSILLSLAGDVTAVVVGCGALLGRLESRRSAGRDLFKRDLANPNITNAKPAIAARSQVEFTSALNI